jgi:hypothetical protein
MKVYVRWAKFAGVVFAVCITLGAWIYASPVASDPDGTFHLVSTWCGSGFKSGQCEPALNHEGKEIAGVVMVPAEIAKNYGNLDTSSLNIEMAANFRNNLGGLYPNGYYWFTSKFVGSEINETVIFLRWMNVLIFAFLLSAASSLLPRNMRKGFALTFSVLLVPLGLFIVASNNPSSWAITSVGTYWAFLYVFLSEKEFKKRIVAGLFCGLSSLIGISARGDASAYLVLTSIVVIAIVHSRGIVDARRLLNRLWVPALVAVFALFTFLNNNQRYVVSDGFVAANGLVGRAPATNPKFDVSSLVYSLTELPGVFAGFFGLEGTLGMLGGGTISVFMPDIVPLSMVFLVATFVSKATATRAKLEIVTLITFLTLICILPLYVVYRSNAVLPDLVQSRYLLPVFISFFGLFLAGSKIESRIRTSRTLKGMTFTLIVASYIVALYTTLRTYVLKANFLSLNLNQGKIWWWNSAVSPLTVWFFGSLACAVVVSSVVYGNTTYLRRNTALLRTANHVAIMIKSYSGKVKLSGD